MSIASSKANGPPTFRYRRRSDISWRSTSRPQKHSVSRFHPACSRALTRSSSEALYFRNWHQTDMPPLTMNVGFQGAGSTGRRNTGVKSLCWGFKLQGLAWSFVELTSHFVQIGLRAHRQVGSLREVLSQQTMVFSFDPRRHGLCGSQKYTSILVASIKRRLTH